jgi:hypothetical protein
MPFVPRIGEGNTRCKKKSLLLYGRNGGKNNQKVR